MPYSIESEIAITEVRVSNFRALSNIEVPLGNLTVLIGANNAGKTSFLDALYAAIGAGRKQLGQDDIRLAPGEAFAPKEREITVDICIRPVGTNGQVIDSFPLGSFWTELWGPGISIDENDFHEFAAIRTKLAWSVAKAEYAIERKFLREWLPFNTWLSATTSDRKVSAAQLEPVALHYIDAKRDLDEDIHKQGSFWRRMTDDLGLTPEDIAVLENSLSEINQQIIDKSTILQHLRLNLSDLNTVVSGDSAGIDISPVARRLRDLSKGIDVSFSTTGAQSFPLARHGMGTRSLASLLVFRAFAAWRNSHAISGNSKVHSMLALEEPESHLHPQAQRALYSHIKKISGQRVVSTHSPYIAGQANLDDLILFIKKNGDTTATKLDTSALTRPNDRRKLQETVIETRGDILFSRAIMLFEGQTEEQALPIWAEKYWDASIHELGFSFVRVNGTDYFPFIWLAKSLQIPWYILADGEALPVSALEKCLKSAQLPDIANSPNIVVFPNGCNFETQLLAEGYLAEAERALDEINGIPNSLDRYIAELDGGKAKGGGLRDYKSPGGRERAAADAMAGAKTALAKPLATIISGLPAPERRFPSKIERFFEIISHDYSLSKFEEAQE